MLDEGFTSKLVVGDDGEIWAQCTDPYTNETFLTKELEDVYKRQAQGSRAPSSAHLRRCGHT